MASVIPLCFPPIAQPGWYYDDPCGSKLGIGVSGDNTGTYYYGGIKITWNGEEVRMWSTSGGVLTTCVDGSTYLSHINSIGFSSQHFYGALIDIWAARRASVWSSSTAITVVADNDPAAIGGNVNVMAGKTYSGGSLFNGATLLQKTASGAVPSCVTLPGVSYTVTVFDNGTVSVT